jgi:hypothetical protein
MEGFMESFIYLLITIVILVLSMRKKKMVQEPEEMGEERTGDPFRDLFRDDDEEEELSQEEHPWNEPAEQPNPWMNEPAMKEEPNPWMTDSEVKNLVLDSDAIMREASENNPIAKLEGATEDDAYEIGLNNDQGVAFDLKKAVIYSEILEKRTF